MADATPGPTTRPLTQNTTSPSARSLLTPYDAIKPNQAPQSGGAIRVGSNPTLITKWFQKYCIDGGNDVVESKFYSHSMSLVGPS